MCISIEVDVFIPSDVIWLSYSDLLGHVESLVLVNEFLDLLLLWLVVILDL
jgi:hypothetical protein